MIFNTAYTMKHINNIYQFNGNATISIKVRAQTDFQTDVQSDGQTTKKLTYKSHKQILTMLEKY